MFTLMTIVRHKGKLLALVIVLATYYYLKRHLSRTKLLQTISRLLTLVEHCNSYLRPHQIQRRQLTPFTLRPYQTASNLLLQLGNITPIQECLKAKQITFQQFRLFVLSQLTLSIAYYNPQPLIDQMKNKFREDFRLLRSQIGYCQRLKKLQDRIAHSVSSKWCELTNDTFEQMLINIPSNKIYEPLQLTNLIDTMVTAITNLKYCAEDEPSSTESGAFKQFLTGQSSRRIKRKIRLTYQSMTQSAKALLSPQMYEILTTLLQTANDPISRPDSGQLIEGQLRSMSQQRQLNNYGNNKQNDQRNRQFGPQSTNKTHKPSIFNRLKSIIPTFEWLQPTSITVSPSAQRFSFQYRLIVQTIEQQLEQAWRNIDGEWQADRINTYTVRQNRTNNLNELDSSVDQQSHLSLLTDNSNLPVTSAIHQTNHFYLSQQFPKLSNIFYCFALLELKQYVESYSFSCLLHSNVEMNAKLVTNRIKLYYEKNHQWNWSLSRDEIHNDSPKQEVHITSNNKITSTNEHKFDTETEKGIEKTQRPQVVQAQAKQCPTRLTPYPSIGRLMSIIYKIGRQQLLLERMTTQSRDRYYLQEQAAAVAYIKNNERNGQRGEQAIAEEVEQESDDELNQSLEETGVNQTPSNNEQSHQVHERPPPTQTVSSQIKPSSYAHLIQLLQEINLHKRFHLAHREFLCKYYMDREQDRLSMMMTGHDQSANSVEEFLRSVTGGDDVMEQTSQSHLARLMQLGGLGSNGVD